MYDYLIVGSGLFGAVFAHEATKAGKKCLVLERRNHIGGNCYTENWNGIQGRFPLLPRVPDRTTSQTVAGKSRCAAVCWGR